MKRAPPHGEAANLSASASERRNPALHGGVIRVVPEER
jgi:hypothetical protein